MELLLKNADVVPFVNLLQGAVASGKEARAVARFRKILMNKFEQYSTDELETLKEYCLLTENGEVDVDENGIFTFLDGKKDEGTKALFELKNEECIVDLTEFKPFLDPLINALNNGCQDLQGVQMDVLDNLVTKLENIGEDDE